MSSPHKRASSIGILVAAALVISQLTTHAQGPAQGSSQGAPPSARELVRRLQRAVPETDWRYGYGTPRGTQSAGYGPLAVTAPAFCSDSGGGSTPGTGKITGLVTAVDTGLPIASASVTAYLGELGEASASTNSTGVYTITGLNTGSYAIQFSPPYASNYLEEWYNDKASRTLADPVAVVSGTTTSGINALLGIGAQITGAVTASDTGNPLLEVSVVVFTSSGSYLTAASTDADGEYAVQGLPSGSYKLRFDPRGALDDTTRLYVGEYYNDKLEFAAGDLITVTAPSLYPNVNVSLGRGAVITGVVTAADTGLPLEAVDVGAEETAGTYNASIQTDAQGQYSLTVRSGGQTVYFGAPYGSTYVSEFYNDKPSKSAADTVTVTAPAISPNINAVLAKGGLITGRITDAVSGMGLDGAFADFYDVSTGEDIGYGYADAAGYYTATAGLRTGSYKVGFDQYDYVARYYNGKDTLTSADLITVTAPNTAPNINGALVPCSASHKVFLPVAIRQ